LARPTGGEFFQPGAIAEIIPICGHIARDIRSQYTIAYTPANATADGAFRNIQVKAKAPGEDRLIVRTRTGYYAPGVTSTSAPTKPPRGHASLAHSGAQK
jgi:VWFA-related protein